MKGREYWRERYKVGGDSGSGSRGKLAKFKAEIINDFIKTHDIKTVIDFGCGDGKQAALIKAPLYVGYDISVDALVRCRELFKDDPTRVFFNDTGEYTRRAELVLSLDVVYHLIDDDVFKRYMDGLFKMARRYVIIYSCDFDQADGPEFAEHVRPRKFTDYVDHTFNNFLLVERIPNRYPFKLSNLSETSFSDFFIYQRIS